MKLIIKKNYEEMCAEAAKTIKEQLDHKKDTTLGLATGSTPEGVYKELIKYYKNGEIDFSQVRTFNLDEYIGLSKENINSFNYFMNDKLFDHINIDKKNIHIPNCDGKNIEEFCRNYDKMIEDSGGIDLQIVGVGQNGHIAFNEPANQLSFGTTIVELAENTIEINSRFFDSIEDVPKKAITMGMGTIMQAEKIIWIANGKGKSKVVEKFLSEKTITTEFPVSILKLHKDLTIIVDEQACSSLGR